MLIKTSKKFFFHKNLPNSINILNFTWEKTSNVSLYMYFFSLHGMLCTKIFVSFFHYFVKKKKPKKVSIVLRCWNTVFLVKTFLSEHIVLYIGTYRWRIDQLSSSIKSLLVIGNNNSARPDVMTNVLVQNCREKDVINNKSPTKRSLEVNVSGIKKYNIYIYYIHI